MQTNKIHFIKKRLLTAISIASLILIATLLPEELSLQRWIAAFFAANALVGMAVSFILATRLPILETMFGGLDRVYKAHRWAGVWAVFSIFMHWGLVPQSQKQRSDFNLIELGSDAGEWAIWLLLALVVVSFLKIIPYQWWKWTHRLMGLVFIITVLHYIFSLKPFGLFSPAGIAMNVTSVIGLWGWWYCFKNYSKSRCYPGKVNSITRNKGSITFEVKPLAGIPDWKAGQFAFISFPNHLNLSDEEHPFTIASSHSEKKPRFSVAALGDYTCQLNQSLKKGDLVKLNMPYGRFQLNSNNKQQIWIGTGIGITPFIAWLQELAVNPLNCPDVDIYYLVRNEESAVFKAELLELCSNLEKINLHIYYSDSERLSPEKIKEKLKDKILQSELYFCGNPKIRQLFQSELESLGMPRNQTHFELFDFRGAF